LAVETASMVSAKKKKVLRHSADLAERCDCKSWIEVLVRALGTCQQNVLQAPGHGPSIQFQKKLLSEWPGRNDWL
jgi:hypothetical protein